MTAVPAPRKTHRLRDGSLGTHWEALREKLTVLQKEKQRLEDEIEITQIEMLTAEGAPIP